MKASVQAVVQQFDRSNKNVELQGGMGGEEGGGGEVGVAVDLLPGVDSSGASIPSGSMEA